MRSWRKAVAYVSCSAVFIDFCLYSMFRYLLLTAPIIYTPHLDGTKSTLFSDAFPWFFWTATVFIVISLILGVYLRSRTRAWQTSFYVYGVFLTAFVVEVFQSVAFFYLCEDIPPSYPYLGMTVQESELFGFFVLRTPLLLFCFLTAGAGLGLYIGKQIKLEGS